MKLNSILAMALCLSAAARCVAQGVPAPQYSIGVTLDSGGRIAEVLWDSPAFKAGLSQGFTVVAVNGKAYKPELLRSAISAAKSAQQPIELLLRQADRYQTTRIDYREGLKYPRLERIEGTPDRLEAIFRPRS